MPKPYEQTATLSETLARHVAATEWDAIAPSTLTAAKRLMLDTLAVAWAGAGATGIAPVREALAPVSGPGAQGACSLWGMHGRAGAVDAAFINGAAAAALDYDALHIDALVHSQIVTLPGLLAIAEDAHLDGKSLLTSAVLADDINYRLGLAAQGHAGWFFTSIFGVFGAAAAAAKLLGLGAKGIGDAMGIALFQATGTQQSMLEKKLTKRFMSAFAARGAVFAAQLARAGLDAPTQPFEGRFGLFSLYQECDPSIVTKDLGERYENANVNVKKFPSCGCAHALTEATLALVRDHRIVPGDVVRATARISPFMDTLIGGHFDPTPETAQVASQFSGQYAVACALYRHKFGLADIEPANVMDKEVGDFARRVTIQVDASNTGQLAPADITFEMRSGQTLSRRVDTFPGGTGATLADDVLHAKVHDCMSQGPRPLSTGQIDRFIERVRNLENLADTADLFDGL